MKKIAMYKANDGTVFDNEIDCQNYERKEKAITSLMMKLKPRPHDCNFGNGHGYIQQDLNVVKDVMKEFVERIRPVIEFCVKTQEVYDNPFKYRMGIIGRILEDSNEHILYRAWGRFMNIDEQGREWGQCYFALNPHKGDQIRLNAQ